MAGIPATLVVGPLVGACIPGVFVTLALSLIHLPSASFLAGGVEGVLDVVVWAVEWTFFALEVAAGYTFYRCGARLSDRLRMRLLVVYSVASWASETARRSWANSLESANMAVAPAVVSTTRK